MKRDESGRYDATVMWIDSGLWRVLAKLMILKMYADRDRQWWTKLATKVPPNENEVKP